MKNSVMAGLLWVACAISVPAQPVIRGALNAASYASGANGVSDIAQGAMFVLFGSGMGPASLAQVSAFPLPTSQGLQGTSVQVTAGGATIDCIMIYTVASQVAAVLPSRTPLGDAQLTVRYNGQTSAPFRIRVVQRAFGTFSINQRGTGPGVIQNVLSETNRPVNGAYRAARPGSVLIIWGTGLGPVAGDEAAGPLPGDLAGAPVEVFVGGRAARIVYRGRSGCCTGLDQIVIEVPAGTSGCFVPVVVKIGNSVSNQTTVAVGDTDTCSEGGQPITAAPPSSGLITYACVGLDRTCTSIAIPGLPAMENCEEGLNAIFGRANLDQLDLSAFYASRTAGSCSVVTLSGNPDTIVAPTPTGDLDAGTITLTGPKGTVTFTRNSSGQYIGKLPQGYLSPGSYTIEGAGGNGADSIGPFRIVANLTPSLTWTNKDAINTIVRASGQEVTWTGGDPNGRVSISGIGFSGTENNAIVTLFFCSERTSARRFTIPPYVLLAVPPASGELPFNGFLIVGDEGDVKNFTAPRLDNGGFSWRSTNGKSVRFQ